MMIPRLKFQKINVPQEGSVIDGTVLSKDKKALYIDVSPLGLAVVRGHEFLSARNYIKDLSIGDKISIKIIELDNEEGLIEASLKEICAQQVWSYFDEIKKNNESIAVKIKEANRGGLLAEVKGIKAFIPASQLSEKHYPTVTDGDKEAILAKLRDLINQEISVKVLDFDPVTQKLILSEKEIQSEAEKQKIAAKYSEGDIIKGEITKVVDFGLFIKFGDPSIDGLIHISEIDYQLIEDPAALYKEGDIVEAKIQNIVNGRISLSIKALKDDPWKDIDDIYKVGKKYQGTVLKTGSLGSLIEFEPGIYGFLKNADASEENKEETKLETQDKKEFIIKSIDKENRRITLSI